MIDADVLVRTAKPALHFRIRGIIFPVYFLLTMNMGGVV